MRRTVRLLPIIALLIVSSGCGGEGSPPPAPKVLRWAIEGIATVPDLEPAMVGSTQQNLLAGLLYGGLVRLDSRLNVRPFAAERWTVSSDGKTYTFYLRPDLKLADGTPVTASDFAYSLNRALAMDQQGGNAGYYLGGISGSEPVQHGQGKAATGIKVVDDSTLAITLDQPASYFLYQLSFATSSLVPRHVVEGTDGKQWQTAAFGLGPFMREPMTATDRLMLKPNPYYIGGKIGLEQIELLLYPTAHAAFADYQAGKLDVMGTQGFDAADLPAAAQMAGYLQASQFTVTYVGFNNARAPFADVRARRAFAQAVGKQTLAGNVLAGLVAPAEAIIPPGMAGYNPAIQKLNFDPAAARRALTEAGVQTGATVRLAVSKDSSQQQVADYLQQSWQRDLGVKVVVDSLDLPDFNRRLTELAANPTASPIDLYLSTWTGDYPDPQNFLSQQLRTGVGNNNGHFSNAEFDRLVDQADVEPNVAERLRLYSRAEQLAISEVGWLPLYYGQANVLVNSQMVGLTYTAQGIMADDWTKVRIK